MSRSTKLINELLAYTGDKLGRNIDSNTLADLLLDEKIGGLIVGGAYTRLNEPLNQVDSFGLLTKKELLAIINRLSKKKPLKIKGKTGMAQDELVILLRNYIYGKNGWYNFYKVAEEEAEDEDEEEEEEDEDDDEDYKKDVQEEQALDKAYEILGLQPIRGTLDFPTLKKTYRTLALQAHPDKHPESEAPKWNKKFRKINDSFKLIKEFAFPSAAGFFGGRVSKKLTLAEAKELFRKTFPKTKI
jgi:hypothetical protein